MMSSNSNNLFGTGMAAQAILDAGVEVSQHFEPTVKKNSILRIKTFGEKENIVACQGPKGMSDLYHGVTPSDVILDKMNFQALEKLNIKQPQRLKKHSGYFVPKRVPRPRSKIYTKIETSSLQNFFGDKNYFCMSVIGNLRALQSLGYIDGPVPVSDDIIFKLGTVELKDNPTSVVQSLSGSFFEARYFSNYMIFFRPCYYRSVEINFSKRALLAGTNNGFQLIEKILCSIYLKFGVHILPPRKWEMYAQLNVKDAYIMQNGDIENKNITEKFLSRERQRILNQISLDYDTFEASGCTYFNGIHLSYNRDFLCAVPRDIEVLDTSLSRGNGIHPTVEMYCKIFNDKAAK